MALAITELDPGGAEKSLTQVALGLARRGHRVEVISLAPRPMEPKGGLVARLDAAAVPMHFLDVTSHWQTVSAIHRMTKVLRRLRTEVLQTFLYHANVIGALAGRRAGVSHVVSGIRQREPSAWRRRIERRFTAANDACVCVSHAVGEDCKQTGWPTEKIEVIHNGVDLADYEDLPSRETLHLPTARPYLLFAGRLEEQKGPDLLLNAWQQAAGKLPEFDLVLAGDGPLRNRLEEQAARAGIAPRTHFLGWRPEIAALLASAELLVLPSRWEGLPNVVLEAMACERAVVATDVEGVRELLGAEHGGQIVPGGDPAALAGRIVELVEDRNRRETLAAGNRERAAGSFSLGAMIDAYEGLFERLANR